MVTDWNPDPPDGVLCLLATRRVLDQYGHCCDYNRCPALCESSYWGMDRCLLDVGHEGLHHGTHCWYWT